MVRKPVENELLFLAARPSLNPAATDRMRSLVREVADWRDLLTLAQEHGVLPLLYHHLRSAAANDVPPHFMVQLAKMNEANTKHALYLAGELIKLQCIAEVHAIDVLPFKGPTLAVLAYGDLGLRQFADLDILVRRKDLATMTNLLIGQGFVGTPQLTRSQQAALLRYDCAQNFRRGENLLLDVHWDLCPKYLSISVDSEELWERRQPVGLEQQKMRTFSQEDLLMALCVHGFTHYWERLGWISDVSALVNRNTTDWHLLLQNVERLGVRRILSVGLLLAHDLLEAPIPAEIMQTLKHDQTAIALANQFAERLFWFEPDNPPPAPLLLNVRIRERGRDKVLTWLRLFTTPRVFDWEAVSLPVSFPFLYYLVRPIRLAYKSAKCLLRQLTNWRSPQTGSVEELG